MKVFALSPVLNASKQWTSRSSILTPEFSFGHCGFQPHRRLNRVYIQRGLRGSARTLSFYRWISLFWPPSKEVKTKQDAWEFNICPKVLLSHNFGILVEKFLRAICAKFNRNRSINLKSPPGGWRHGPSRGGGWGWGKWGENQNFCNASLFLHM